VINWFFSKTNNKEGVKLKENGRYALNTPLFRNQNGSSLLVDG